MHTDRHLRTYTVRLDCGCFVFTDRLDYGALMNGIAPFHGIPVEYCPMHGANEMSAAVLNGAGYFEMPSGDE